jgi:hypothetical protein
MAAGDLMPGPTPGPSTTARLPKALRRCRRVVAVTVHLPEFLLGAAGLIQRLGASGMQIDVLVAGAADEDTEDAAGVGLGELRVPGLFRHRLALPAGFGADRADDLLAALSELVGFDPEPGVCCLAPDADGSEPSRAAVRAAAERVSDVYRLRLVRFAATPDDAGVELNLDTEEWARKCAGLAACADQVSPLSGNLEYFSI